MEVYDRVKKVIVDVLGADGENVTMDSSFIDDLGADSLDLVELIMDFEEEFALEVSDEEAMTWLTVKDAVRYAESKS